MTIKVTCIDSHGAVRVVEGAPGVSVMAVATAQGVPEIETDCGGVCACASCHVYVDNEWLPKLSPMSKNENSLLGLLESRRPNSRLCCQITLTEELDGLALHTVDPEA